MGLAYIEDLLRKNHLQHQRKPDGTLIWPCDGRYTNRCHPIHIADDWEGYLSAEVYFPCRVPPTVEQICKDINEWLASGIGVGYKDGEGSGFYFRVMFKPDYVNEAIYQLVSACDSFIPIYDHVVKGDDCGERMVMLAFMSEEYFNHG